MTARLDDLIRRLEVMVVWLAGIGGAIILAEGMVLAMKSGLDARQVAEALQGGAAGSWGLTHRGPNMLKGAYPLGFRTRLHRKDLGIALEAAREAGVPLPTTVVGREVSTARASTGTKADPLGLPATGSGRGSTGTGVNPSARVMNVAIWPRVTTSLGQ